MAKRSTPKQKLAKSRSRNRYGSFQTKVRKRLANLTNLVKCATCGAKVPPHTVCKQCGQYKGRQVIDVEKEMKKITKIKA
ncbi:50S ribosomal protein L32 [Candidatus Peregrinibacteria bacterium]|jgi:large subunit ribosomal protein L32|nr:50S ribosomal protein L32 [Candidatus Peregrinibacteria bacterium]MBT4148011.1 50S ribosomal protein L32 [Candidatus Peregrinibacteria bacterium]MBT4366750.1 50S ribosomal protein L32 [Candidatus Peregrinibacteria bacterium]MBT4456329.1 50S ribosomal protein L32 [Candidatus Peregrinibacteria bacterium]